MNSPGVTVHESYHPRERRAVARCRVDHRHQAMVLLTRALYVAAHGGVPVWQPGEGLRTVRPAKARAA